MTAHEVNFDGLVGLTHNYGGLAVGNVAAAENALSDSNPKEAALQGLAKMKYLRTWASGRACCRPRNGRRWPCSGNWALAVTISR